MADLQPDIETMHPESQWLLIRSENEQLTLTDEQYSDLSDWAEMRGVFLGRNRRNMLFLSAPWVPMNLEFAFHATAVSYLGAIQTQGLRRGKSNCDRGDEVGNIYATEKLGTPVDQLNDQSGFGWRNHFRKTKRFGETDWCVLRIDLQGINNLRLSKSDPWSHSGLILRTEIPPERLQRVDV